MSLNTAHTADRKGILLYNGERVLSTGGDWITVRGCPSGYQTLTTDGVVLSLRDHVHPLFKDDKNGSLYFTTHRIIFKTKPSERTEFRSFSIPFSCLRNVRLEQPLFGANYLNGIVDAQPGANWQGSTRWTMTFKKGGCIGFGTALLRAIHQGLRKIFEDSNPKN